MRFRLLTSLHIQNNDKGEPVTYRPGDIVESDEDLTRKHGATKFQPLDGDVEVVPGDFSPVNPLQQVNSFPGGQVSEGMQQSVAGQPSAQTQFTQEEVLGKQRQTAERLKYLKQEKRERGEEDEPEDSDVEGRVGRPSGRPVRAEEETSTPATPSPSAGATAGESGSKAKPEFDNMSLNDLNKYAEENRIPLRGAKSRAEVLKVLKAH